jgi:hypothetical protein
MNPGLLPGGFRRNLRYLVNGAAQRGDASRSNSHCGRVSVEDASSACHIGQVPGVSLVGPGIEGM